MELAAYNLDIPILLTWREEVDAESRGYETAVGILLPVDGEGIELVATEVHHRIELVHESVGKPLLSVLAHFCARVPTIA